MGKITESTLVPISLVLVLIGATAWASAIHTDVVRAGESIKQLEGKQDEYIRTIQKIDERLSRIEGQLGLKRFK
jgi:hypothetical protein